MIKKEKIVAIVVTYNIEKELLLENINSYSDFVDKVIIVDNSDEDMRLNTLRDEKKIYISLNGNKGIAKGLNVGIQYALENKYSYALTMDQDSKFNNNLIDEYRKNEQKDIIIYSPNYYIERKRKRTYKSDTNYVCWTMTSGNLLNLELYKKNGQFMEKLFIDAVDYEYCLRARKNGYKILQCNKAVLIHNPGITKAKKFLFKEYKYGYMSTTRMYYQVRNLRYLVKEYKSFRAGIIILIKFMKIIILFENKKEYIKYFIKGIKDSKNNIYGKIS